MQFHVSFFDMHWWPNAQNLELSTKVRENTINLSGILSERKLGPYMWEIDSHAAWLQPK